MPPEPLPKAFGSTCQLSWMARVMPVVPDHELVRRIGGGNYGDMWLARTDHWHVGRGEIRAPLVDNFQLHPGNSAAARGVAVGGQGCVHVVGQAVTRDFVAHWIVRKSATGEAGSWSINDDFAPSSPTAADGITRLPDGSLTSRANETSGGLCILGDSKRVLAGDWSNGGLNHATVRRLELSGANNLSVARAQ